MVKIIILTLQFFGFGLQALDQEFQIDSAPTQLVYQLTDLNKIESISHFHSHLYPIYLNSEFRGSSVAISESTLFTNAHVVHSSVSDFSIYDIHTTANKSKINAQIVDSGILRLINQNIPTYYFVKNSDQDWAKIKLATKLKKVKKFNQSCDLKKNLSMVNYFEFPDKILGISIQHNCQVIESIEPNEGVYYYSCKGQPGYSGGIVYQILNREISICGLHGGQSNSFYVTDTTKQTRPLSYFVKFENIY